LPVVEQTKEAIACRDLLASAVREAGALALTTFRTPLKTWTKHHDSPVSEADIAVDELLKQRLAGARPDFGWLSEETEDDERRMQAPMVWVVDPIDGTRAYIAGYEDWSISAALVAGGRPVAAAIYVPVADQMFIAAQGEGATINDVTIAASDGAELDGARIAGPQGYLKRLNAARPAIVAMPKVHSLALRLARVASGELDAALASGNAHDWDLAAADLLVHEAGGALTALDGRHLAYNQPTPRHGILVAAGRSRHETLIEVVRNKGIA
jgi:myo-inositol-1(or 4)-monophosphatase